jgi:hypothetical protein
MRFASRLFAPEGHFTLIQLPGIRQNRRFVDLSPVVRNPNLAKSIRCGGFTSNLSTL